MAIHHHDNVKFWRPFCEYIISVTKEDGAFLQDFLKQARIKGSIHENYEILDYQRYKVVRNKSKVAAFSQQDLEEKRFQFLVCSN